MVDCCKLAPLVEFVEEVKEEVSGDADNELVGFGPPVVSCMESRNVLYDSASRLAELF